MKISNERKNIFFGSDFFRKQDMDAKEKIVAKKQQRFKEAMHVVTSARNGEKKIDDSLDDIRGQIKQYQKDNDEANKFLTDINNQMSEVKDYYQVEDDSQEQKDLELLQKQYDMMKHGSMETLTEEEQERLDNMGELTEYQKRSMELYGQADYWKTQMQDNQDKISQSTGVIRNVRVERLKSQAMAEAQRAKEEIMDAASQEAIGMLVDDAKQQIDDKAEEVQEAAKERQEEQKEEEKRVEAAKENKSQVEAAVEKNREKIADMTKQFTDSEDITRDMDSEIKKVLEEEKLLEEDLKGLTVNAKI